MVESTDLVLTGQVADQPVRHRLTGSEIVLGRSPECDVMLGDGAVSRRHARIYQEEGRYWVEDLGSQNGTHLNGSPITAPAPLGPGDRLAFATVELAITTGDGTAAPGPAFSHSAGLTVVETPHQGSEFSWQDYQAMREGRDMKAGHADRHAHLFAILGEAGKLLTSALDVDALDEPVLDLVTSAFSPERAALMLLDEASGDLKISAARGRGTEATEEIVLSRTVVNRILTEKTSFLLEDVADNELFRSQESIVIQGIRSAMAVPVVEEDRVTGLLYADTSDPIRRYHEDDLQVFTLLAGVIAEGLIQTRYQRSERERRRLETELDAARNILDTILPSDLPDVSGYELGTHLDPCFEVGGDFYDLMELPDGRLLVVTGDVTGKGLGAALIVATLVPTLRTLVELETDPLCLITRINAHLWRATDPIHFATLFLGILDPATGHLSYVNAGHNPPYLVSADGALEKLAATGPPAGMFQQMPYTAASAELAPGAVMVLYSDGVTEAETEGVQFGDKGFEETLCAVAGCCVKDTTDRLLSDLGAFLAGKPADDDVTLVMVRREG